MLNLFGKKWFRKNQKLLLWLLNDSIFKVVFHRILGINEDISYSYCMAIPNQKITEIGIGHYVFNGVHKKFKRKPYKVSKRVCIAFYPIWWISYGWHILNIVPAYTLARLTGKPRYKPKIEWSSYSFTHNAFRVYEAVFGRRVGIRPEISTMYNGVESVAQAHSFEGACALFETAIRELLENLRLPVRVWIPQFSSVNGLPMPKANYMFAIAFDAKANVAEALGSDPHTYSHTCTGSNLVLVVGAGLDRIGIPSSASYNAVAMTAQTLVGGIAPYGRQWTLVNPATGAHTVSVSCGGTSSAGGIISVSSSYTGVDQTTPVGTTNTATANNVALSTTYANSYIVDMIIEQSDTDTLVKGASQTLLYSLKGGPSGSMANGASSYQATTTTGSYTMSWSGDTGGPKIMALELQPFVPPPLTFSVADSITITENIQLVLVQKPNVFQTVTITENIQMQLVQKPNVSDSITVSENIQMQLVQKPNVSDSITVSENIAIVLVFKPSVFDSITVSESISFDIRVSPNVSDSVTVSENVQLIIVSLINVFQSVTVSENVQIVLVGNPSVSDSITVSENVQILLIQKPNVSDSITVSENLTIVLIKDPNVSDSITVSESVSFDIRVQPNVSDSITVSENIQVVIVSLISVFDSISVSENVQIQLVQNDVSSDSITVSEDIAMLLISFINVNDSVSVSESVTLLIPSDVAVVSDSISISENVAISIISFIFVSETISILEDFSTGSQNVGVSDNITVSENVKINILVSDIVFDSITVSENVNISIITSVGLFETITVSESVNLELISFIKVYESVNVSEFIQIGILVPVDRGDLFPQLGYHFATYIVQADKQSTVQLGYKNGSYILTGPDDSNTLQNESLNKNNKLSL